MTLLHRVVAIVLVALLPALGAEIYNQRALRAAQFAELERDTLQQAGAAAAELGHILDGTRDAMVALSALPALLTQDGPGCSQLLQSIRGRFAAIAVLALIGADDRVVCSSAPQAVRGAAAASLAHVVLARSRGGFAVAGYLFSRWMHSGTLATARPLVPEGDAAGAVLVADLGLDWLGRQLGALARSGGSHIVVVDAHGVVLVATDGQTAPGTLLRGAARSLFAPGGPVSADLTQPDGTRQRIAVARLPDLTVLAWLEHSPGAAAQRRAALRSDAMFAAGLLTALALALILARRTVSMPVERILRTVTRWRQGDASARVPAGAPASELGRIGAALNELLAAFESTEAGLLAERRELESRVAERTSRLEAEVREREQVQMQLQQAQRMEVIGRLTGGVAHDFNNLLTAVIGNLELAAMRCADRPPVTRLLGSAMRAAERGAALTQRMLAFGRQQYLKLQPVDVTALLGGMRDLLTRSIGPTVLLRVQAAPDLWAARADASQLELVLLNLAINARDAMPQGGSLLIAAANETVRDGAPHAARLAAGDYVRVAVRDDGTGIEPETLGRVLEPFFTTKPAGKGSGLGLSMAQGVLAQSGGGLAIDSAMGQGTTVRLWLPRAPAPATAPAAAAPTVPPPASLPAPPRPGMAVLLVDDDEAVAEVARRTLLDAGFAVLLRPDGAAALALLDGGTAIDLLIADLAMPGMNGLQLAAAARARRPGLPVLLATGATGSAALRDGDSGYPILEKPFRAAQLLRSVASLVAPPVVAPPVVAPPLSSGQ